MNTSPRTAVEPIRDRVELLSAIHSLHACLRVIERGVEPDLGRHLAEIARIADFGHVHMPGALPLYCRELEMRLWVLACCALPASVEDLDVFLQLLGRIELSVHRDGAGVPVETPEPLPAERRTRSRRGRLCAHPSAHGLELGVPDAEGGAELDRLLEDLTVLWEITHKSNAWTIDCSKLRRVPLALLAHLIDLRLQDGRNPRLMRITGLADSSRSPELSRIVREHFTGSAH